MANYREEADSDAHDTVDYFFDEVVEFLLDNAEASDDLLNDYPNGDAYHHESHTDKSYNLTDAAALLDELYDYEETDSGLWEGQAPRDAISTQAAFTYANAVYSLFQDLIKEINDSWDEQEIDTERPNAKKLTERVVRAVLAGETLEAPEAPEGPKEWHPRRKGK